MTANMKEVAFNPKFSLKENLDFYVNRIMGQFCMSVDVSIIDIEDIYSKAGGFQESDIACSQVKVVVTRT